MQAKLIITFERLGEEAFFAKAEYIDSSLSSAPATTYFAPPWPAAVPTPAMLHTSFLAYQSAYNAAKGGDSGKIIARKAARKALTTILKQIAPYLELVAAGNVAMLESTGYDLRHAIVRSQHLDGLPAPDGFSVKRGNLMGLLVGKCRKLAGAGSYVGQLCTGDPAVDANWADAVITSRCSRIEFPGLTPGKIYYVRLCGVGSNGRGAWTPAISIMVV